MFKKRILAILVCALMAIGNMSFLQKEAEAAGDTTPPQLISISIDKTSVTAGESVKIRAEVTDNGGSGVKEVSVYYKSPDSKSTKVVLSKTAEGIYEGTFTLSQFEVSGVWKIHYVYMLDMSYNPVFIYNAAITSFTPNMDFSSCNFTLFGTTADKTAPVFKSISVDKTAATVGDSVKVRAEASDNGGSGVNTAYVYYRNPHNINSKNVKLTKIQEGIYEGTITFTSSDELGLWRIDSVYLSDAMNNSVTIYNSNLNTLQPNQDLSSGDINHLVLAVIKSISVDKTAAAIGDSVKVRVEASDNSGSGLGTAYLYYRSPGIPSLKSVTLTKIQEGIYEGTVTFTSLDASGSWRIDSVYLHGAGYNSVTIYNSNLYTLQPNQDLSSGDINLAVDVISPSLKSISIDKTIVALGDSVKVRAEVIDNSGLGIKNIFVAYEPASPNYGIKTVNLQKVQEGVYEGTLTLNDISQIGLWKIAQVHMEDMAGNYKNIFNSIENPQMPNQDMSNCDFYLTDGGPIPDIAPPVFKSVSVDKTSVIGRDYVKVTVNAVDNGDAGISGIAIAYRIPNSYEPIYVTMSKVQEGVNEASIYPDNYDFLGLGLWQIEYIKLFDNAGNESVVYNSNINQSSPSMDLSGGNFEFMAPKPVTGITLDKSELTINLRQTAQLNAAITPEDAFNKQVNWRSSDPNVVYVDSTGCITAIEKGTAVISATSNDGGYTAECTVTVTKPVEGVSLNMNEATLEIGENLTLTASVYPYDATDTNVVWSSSNTEAAVVDQSGNITAVGSGTAVISATSNDGGYTAECIVTVVTKPVEGVSLNMNEATLKIGENLALTASVYPYDATDTNVVWSSSNTEAAVVDQSGNITAVGSGTAVISATSNDGGYTAECTVTVTKPVEGVSLNMTETTLEKDQICYLSASVLPYDATNPKVTWSSSNTSVATVDEYGTVTAVSPGTAVITATSEDGGLTATCSVTVLQHAESVTLNETKLTIDKGATSQLTATVLPDSSYNKNVFWSSSDTTIAEVDGNGLVTALQPGTTVITAITEDGDFSASCSVTVLQHAESITLNEKALTLDKEETSQLTAAVLPDSSSNKNIIWSSSDTSVAVVNQSGLVTAVGGGTAVITATTEDGGLTASCSITVLQHAEYVTLNETTLNISKEETSQLIAAVYPTNSFNKDVTWSSSDTSVATVDANGLVKALKPGTAVITVKTVDGSRTATCTVNVSGNSKITNPGFKK